MIQFTDIAKIYQMSNFNGHNFGFDTLKYWFGSILITV